MLLMGGRILIVVGVLLMAAGCGWYARGRWDAGTIANLEKKIALIDATAKAEEKRNAENERAARAELERQDIRLRSAIAAADGAAARAERLEVANRDLLRSVRLPSVARLVLNASVGHEAAPARANEGNDGEARPTEADLNLDDVVKNAIENNANHLKCVAQVEAWQSFWPKVKQLCEGSSGQSEGAASH